MKLFSCTACGHLAYFENTRCTHCGKTLGFLPGQLRLVALEPDNNLWRISHSDDPRRWRTCQNQLQHNVCNWMLDSEENDAFCLACRLNRTIPDLSIAGNLQLWRKLETEKRRLVYSLLRLNLKIQPLGESPEGLAFDFLADQPTFNERGRVLTGHAQGVITLNISEADPVLREKMRSEMAEPYRTVLGHFRHESGHFYWDRLIRDSNALESWRSLFGDERLDYSQALNNHYTQGPPGDWPERFVSAYAASHPWEDWAETWAHFLHIVDTLETAHQFGLRTAPPNGDEENLSLDEPLNPYHEPDFNKVFDHWLALTIALNSLNRSMGHDHAYPFVLTETIKQKLAFVHAQVRHAGSE
ncbi:MAG: hypothetical protein CMI01_12810 [Oceanospirillaceae bacterium]|nr:hypothetical protein [Oceanospirillaceae bacterium]